MSLINHSFVVSYIILENYLINKRLKSIDETLLCNQIHLPVVMYLILIVLFRFFFLPPGCVVQCSRMMAPRTRESPERRKASGFGCQSVHEVLIFFPPVFFFKFTTQTSNCLSKIRRCRIRILARGGLSSRHPLDLLCVTILLTMQ